MRFVFPPIRRSRNPLVRALSVIAGLAVVGVLLVFGTIVIGLLVVGSVVFFAWRQWKIARGGQVGPQAAPAAESRARDPNVLKGEFTVIQQGRPVHH
ncbi:MAG: hypothetical protein GAK28_04482 [Luteibacter sp.]|uniref:hypothetical protein n=1 Tax=Luteibacter sp. TaxID=1886636 RepID=UPI00137EFBCE|nr:hypothetical protein [Luteibacter sp.]KAF1003714.1 MAG: hypothetical protein GAK28_04482 [Luteibacter sp.]